MTLKYIISIGFAFGVAQTALAGPSVNDMSGCQAVLKFVDGKLDTISNDKYDAADVKAVKKGLKLYSDFIQDTHITPGLLTFNGGDTAKADAMQTQVSDYQKTLVAAYNAKYPQDRLFTDQAVAIDGCYKKAPMDAAGEATLKTTLETMVKLAMKG